jgi:alkaline phosphatase D
MLDTRQYRTDQPCGDNVQLVCPETRDERATILGAAQERWLTGGLDRSRTRWNLLAQQVPIAKIDRAPGPEQRYSMDKWDGYEMSRARLLQFLGTRRPSNPVTLAGDVHNNWVNDLRQVPEDPKSPVVATEFVGTSITSAGDGSDMSPNMKAVVSENECVRFANDQRGYVTFDMVLDQLRADYRVVEYVSRLGSPIRTRASFIVEDGEPGAKQV